MRILSSLIISTSVFAVTSTSLLFATSSLHNFSKQFDLIDVN